MADKKTPSARVVAAYVIRETLQRFEQFSAEDMSALVDSRVSADKRAKGHEETFSEKLVTKKK